MTSTIIEPVKSTKALRTISYARSSGLIGICLLALGAQSVKASGEKTPALMDQQSQCLWRRRPHLSFFQKIPRRRGDIEASPGIKSVAQQNECSAQFSKHYHTKPCHQGSFLGAIGPY
jgi:hypothetical protein